MENLYHRGIMRTKMDECQFIIVEKKDYYNILNQSENLTRKIEDENGELVMVVENRILDASGRRGPVVIKVSFFPALKRNKLKLIFQSSTVQSAGLPPTVILPF